MIFLKERLSHSSVRLSSVIQKIPRQDVTHVESCHNPNPSIYHHLKEYKSPVVNEVLTSFIQVTLQNISIKYT